MHPVTVEVSLPEVKDEDLLILITPEGQITFVTTPDFAPSPQQETLIQLLTAFGDIPDLAEAIRDSIAEAARTRLTQERPDGDV